MAGRVTLFPAGHVAGHGQRGAARLRDAAGHLLGARLADVDDGDLRPLPRVTLGDGAADALP